MATPVSIVSITSFSPLGTTSRQVWDSYLDNATLIRDFPAGTKAIPAAQLSPAQHELAEALRHENPRYRHLDKSVLYSIIASRAAVEAAGWQAHDTFGINIGSSRGATALFEHYHSEYLATGKTGTQASPATTLGNISSWVAQDLKSAGPEISHSVTCSTALHAVLNGVAWLRAGMARKFLTGGSEAPLTPFTIAQMQAMKIYAAPGHRYPCRAFDLEKPHNTMVLGEGAASACLEAGNSPHALAFVEGIGYATETLEHSASISADAQCLQRSMEMALHGIPKEAIDVVVMHAPGTVKGDLSEFRAIQSVFGASLPLLTSNKWKIGHTFGASGLLSLEMAVLMLQHGTFIGMPYLPGSPTQKKPVRKVLVNAVGFGGNAVSLVISK